MKPHSPSPLRVVPVLNSTLCSLLAGLWLGSSAPLRAESVAEPVPKPVRVAGEELPALGFDFLAGYKYKTVDAGTGASPAEIEAAKKTDQVPAKVRAFDGQRVLLTGYMLPLTMTGGRSFKFVLMKDVNTCCYGATPSMNDYITVTMKPGAGAAVSQDVPVQVTGTLRIKQVYDSGYVVSLYTLEGERFLGEKK